jgi:cupin fold WbuC family metalloprotein
MSSPLSAWRKVSDGVFVPAVNKESGVVSVGAAEILALKQEAQNSNRKRARLCSHLSSEDTLHQMLLVIQRESYVRPHRHKNKVESFHMIEGEMDVLIFNDQAQVVEKISMSAYPKPAGVFMYRLNKSLYHTLIIHTPSVVFHEITEGPFVPDQTDFAGWAPLETDHEKAQQWLNNLRKETSGA